tara:strand:- start:475 stop:735 length:261 start_codon:yes stop_codon:yes gene_type:complete
MIKDEKPYITHEGKEYRCYQAGYYNPVQHKWQFVIDGVDSNIRYQEWIEFMGLKLKVCFSLRRKAEVTSMFNNVSGKETYLEAWQI